MYARSRDVISWCEDRMGDVEDVIRSILVSYKITCSKDILFYKLQSLSHHYSRDHFLEKRPYKKGQGILQ